MIKPIQIYVVDDGTRFDKYDDAVYYENLCKKCSDIEAKLTPRTAEVNNMTGYISHDPVKFKEALTEFKKSLFVRNSVMIICVHKLSWMHLILVILDII